MTNLRRGWTYDQDRCYYHSHSHTLIHSLYLTSELLMHRAHTHLIISVHMWVHTHIHTHTRSHSCKVRHTHTVTPVLQIYVLLYTYTISFSQYPNSPYIHSLWLRISYGGTGQCMLSHWCCPSALARQRQQAPWPLQVLLRTDDSPGDICTLL